MVELKLDPPKGEGFQMRKVLGGEAVSENSTFRVLFIFGKGFISRRGKSWVGRLCA
jgi:hypothetical protein